MLVVLEGVDGAGKTEVCRQLLLNKSLLPKFVLTKEPGSNLSKVSAFCARLLRYCNKPILRWFRGILLYLDHLFHVKQLEKLDGLIICDRFYPISARVYRNRNPEWRINPDLIIYLKVDYSTAWIRCKIKQDLYLKYLFKNLDSLIRKYESTLLELSTKFRVVTVDATQPLPVVVSEVITLIKGVWDETTTT